MQFFEWLDNFFTFPLVKIIHKSINYLLSKIFINKTTRRLIIRYILQHTNLTIREAVEVINAVNSDISQQQKLLSKILIIVGIFVLNKNHQADEKNAE